MPCYRPIKGYRAARANASGKRGIVFNASEALSLDARLDIPCGQCIGCRLERSRQWAIRCVHEASLYDRNCFITLTYSPEFLPADGSLVLKDFQDFMKRLRFKFGAGIRFFHCGEYGERFQRPHYHACLFNFDFDDRELLSVRDGVKLFRSETLEELWEKKGFCTVGDVTFESAAYVARYVTKKITGDRADSYYGGRKPEYTTMSRRPGLGKGWFQRFAGDVFPFDEVVLRGVVMKPPKYYDRIFELTCADEFNNVKRKRKHLAERLSNSEISTRLGVKEQVAELRFKELRRGYECPEGLHGI